MGGATGGANPTLNSLGASGTQMPSWLTSMMSSTGQGQTPGQAPAVTANNGLINGYVGNSRSSSMGNLSSSLGLPGASSAGNAPVANTQQQGSYGAVPLAPQADPNGAFQLAESYNANPQMPEVPGTNLMGHPAWAANAWGAGNGSWTEGGEAFDAARQSLQGPMPDAPAKGQYIGTKASSAARKPAGAGAGGGTGTRNQVGPMRYLPGGGWTTFPQNHPQAQDYNGKDPGDWMPYGSQKWVPGMPLIPGGAPR